MAGKMIVAVTGASGSIYAKHLLLELQKLKAIDVAVIFSEEGKKVWKHELGEPIADLPFKIFNIDDFFAPFASGSSDYDTMIVCPCSMGTLARIANGLADNLIARSADVVLKERRRLILVTRETPYNLIHIQNMEKATLAGAIVFPASPSFYQKPASIDDMARNMALRILQTAGIASDLKRWGSY